LALALVAGTLLVGGGVGGFGTEGSASTEVAGLSRPLELEGAGGKDGTSVETLEERAKEKEIEAQIRQAAAKLERERAETMDSKAEAEGEHANAVKDKAVAKDDISEARKLTSESVREKNDARLAEQKVMTSLATVLHEVVTAEPRHKPSPSFWG